MNQSEPSSLELRQLSVTIDDQQNLRQLTLSILPGELFVLLGASEAGKSTVLRTIAGLDPVADGEIWLDELDITSLPAHRRHTSLLAQSYPLWPNLNVARNVAFAMKRQGVGRKALKARVAEELSAVGLAEFKRHLPMQLSASQQQRVQRPGPAAASPAADAAETTPAAVRADDPDEQQGPLRGLPGGGPYRRAA